jgi:DNA polymerase III subunit epsilon
VQTSFEELGEALIDVTFVVVDLETTGGAAKDAGITEIGAVKVKGGERLGTFQTLVNPQRSIPPFIATLTGITDAHVAQAPLLPAVLPAFLAFADGAVLVAHNAPYDIGFLKAACARFDYTWPAPIVVDTARLARVCLHPGEVRNCKLATLAAHVRASTTPIHRALADAEATTDVLHYLIARAADFGVHSLPDLRAFTANVSKAQRTKRHLADGLPHAPGVYVFRDQQDSALYIGTSRNIAKRVRSYFTASEQRRRIADMIAIAQRVQAVPCATTVEAHVREIRLISELQPRYNRRSRRAERAPWLKLTNEPAPRLSIVREPKDDTAEGAMYLGPFGSRGAAEQVQELLQFAYGLRTCTTKLAASPRATVAGCSLAELGRCDAPCMRDHNAAAYAARVARVRALFHGHTAELQQIIHQHIARLADTERFEDAARWRDRLLATLRQVLRTHQIRMLAINPQIVAAEPTSDGGWDLHCIRYGTLAGAAHAPRGTDPKPVVAQLLAQAEVITKPMSLLARTGEETALLHRWLTNDGIRLVDVDIPLALPVDCGGQHIAELTTAQQAMHWPGESQLRPTGPVQARPTSRISLAG